ncbi:unnamed protein product [Caenorhabditis auriculariae]|uniref:Uncharacterized protein n=1 Tax=Caenorhabditis auriculariae TaxID=2777116 RepID=A0A8S1HKQ4_9PELO|nr:unnamed protein product [Caenorhabditis auriculariae]
MEELLLRVLMHAISNLVSIPTFVILCSYSSLHQNFRTILIIITISGNVISIMSYVQCYFMYVDRTVLQDPSDAISIMLYISTFTFVFANLCLTLERLLAVQFVAHYEKYSAYNSAAAVTAFATVVPAVISGAVVCFLQTDVLPVCILLLGCSTVSAVISLVLRYKTRSNKVVSMDYSLRKKFQWEENQRTTPLYLYISLNEIFSAILIAVVIYLYKTDYNNILFTSKFDDHLADALDVISAYRTLFTHLAVIYYSKVQRTARKRKQMTELSSAHLATEKYFESINEMWK